MENNKKITETELDDLLSDLDQPQEKKKTGPIRKMRYPDSKLVDSLEYDGELLTVTYAKNGAQYTFPMDHETAMSIYSAPSVGKALLSITKAKDIKGTKVETED